MESGTGISPLVRPTGSDLMIKPAPATRVEAARGAAGAHTGTSDEPVERGGRIGSDPALPSIAQGGDQTVGPTDNSRYARFIDAVRALRLQTSDPQPTPAEMERLLEAARVVFMTDDGIPAEPDMVDTFLTPPDPATAPALNTTLATEPSVETKGGTDPETPAGDGSNAADGTGTDGQRAAPIPSGQPTSAGQSSDQAGSSDNGSVGSEPAPTTPNAAPAEPAVAKAETAPPSPAPTSPGTDV